MRQIYSPLDGFRSPFGRLMGSTAPFTPAALFALAEPGVWYDPSDLTTLFQDPAGTIPVTGPAKADGSPVTVALALDKSKGLVLGPELVTNGTFDSGTTSWIAGSGATLAVTSGQLVVTNPSGGTNRRAYQAFSATVGATYRVQGQMISGGRIGIGTSVAATETVLVGGSVNQVFVATASTMYIGLSVTSATAGETATFDNISVKELPGFHATQATLASRPTYGIVPLGGRRNLLERTEEFENAAWAKTNATVSGTQFIAPNGTTTADLVLTNTTNAQHYAGQSFTVAAATTYTVSAYLKKQTYSATIVVAAGSDGAFLNVNLQTGAVASSGVFGSGFSIVGTPVVTPAAEGYYRCVLSYSVTTSRSVENRFLAYNEATNSGSFVGNTADGFYIWGAQLETGSSATAYQRVGSAYDVTEAGVASLSYLFFDGVANFMVTPTITPGIDKAQVFAGVRKLSDAALGVIAETGTNSFGTSGSLALLSGAGVGSNPSAYALFGTGSTGYASDFISFAAPISNVLTGQFDISQSVGANEAFLRANGSAATRGSTTGTSMGTGNFLAYPLYIGRRNGATLGFNGQIYSLIVRFGTNLDAGTITSTETWVNGKTGAYA